VAHRIISTTQEDESLTGFRDLAVLRLLHATGMRRASVAGLRREHVFERGGRLIAGFYGKGNKWHEATLPEEAADAVRTWLRISVLSTTYVFPQNGGFKPMDPSTVNRIITKRMRGAGVTGVHPHQFRAAFITEALDELPLHEVQAAVGHADPRQTLQYDRRQRGQGVADHVAAKRKR
jgi:integrase